MAAWPVHGLAEKFCFPYTGALAVAHDPDLLLCVAQHYASDPEVAVVVVSEGERAGSLSIVINTGTASPEVRCCRYSRNSQ